MATYAAMVDRLDQNIGRLVAHLTKLSVMDNTLIMFCSDNGACPFERTRGKDLEPWDPESYWTYDTGWAHAGNTPFRWYKQNQHEGGISSPMIVHWPAGLKATPRIQREPAHLVDFMPTALELAKAQYPESFAGREVTPLAGRSLGPAIRNESLGSRESIYFHFSNNRALRKGKWKLVSARGGPWELYDLEADRTELNNLADQQPQQVRELAALWFDFAKNHDHLAKQKRRPVSAKMQPIKPGFFRSAN